METNFIKSKVDIKEEIVKERQVDYSKLKKKPSEKAIKYEEFINEKLKNDLKNVHVQIETICQTISEYLQINATINILKSQPKNVKCLTDISCNFYTQCVIPDASRIFLNIGLDYYLHLELGEAQRIIAIKEEQLNQRLKRLQIEEAKIKSYIKIALGGLDEVLTKQ